MNYNPLVYQELGRSLLRQCFPEVPFTRDFWDLPEGEEQCFDEHELYVKDFTWSMLPLRGYHMPMIMWFLNTKGQLWILPWLCLIVFDLNEADILGIDFFNILRDIDLSLFSGEQLLCLCNLLYLFIESVRLTEEDFEPDDFTHFINQAHSRLRRLQGHYASR